MKLEEVLPAMRAGRVAVDGRSYRYRYANDRFEWHDAPALVWRTVGALVCDDNWTLEPEQKVEWPKGSIQWAAHESCASGHGMIRHRNKDGITAGGIPASRALEYAARMDGVLFSLGWEPVP